MLAFSNVEEILKEFFCVFERLWGGGRAYAEKLLAF